MSRTILESAAGTTAMTLFSQVVSDSANRNYNEPELLAQMLRHSGLKLSKQQARQLGWALHYGVGLAMMTTFRAIAKRGGIAKPLVYGLIGGLAGIAVWNRLFRKHPSPPPTDLAGFFKQLVPAHIIFCLPLLLGQEDKQS